MLALMNDEHKVQDAADKIMALVDENPSEPFSFERKSVETRLISIINGLVDAIENSDNTSYDRGFEDGAYQVEQESQDHISGLEGQIAALEADMEELKKEVEEFEKQLDQAFAAGFEAARSNSESETFEIQ